MVDTVNKRKQAFLLRLPESVQERAVDGAKNEGVSLNHFIALAVAEKLTRMQELQAIASVRPVAVSRPNYPFRRHA